MDDILLRHDLRPGDLGFIIHLHGKIYAQEHGFDSTFEAYVAAPMAQFVHSRSERERLWIAERSERIIGSIAVVAASAQESQLRWFLVDPSARGYGLGKTLLSEAIRFSEQTGYDSMFLWTVSALTAAGHLYKKAGFHLVEEKPGKWGVAVVEQKYLLCHG